MPKNVKDNVKHSFSASNSHLWSPQTHNNYTECCCGFNVLNYILNSSSFLPQVERDMVLWNNKAIKTKPLLAGTKSDELLVKFRRWYSQFYSTEPPEKVKPVDLSWWWWFHTLPQFLPSAISSNCMIRVFCRQLFQ